MAKKIQASTNCYELNFLLLKKEIIKFFACFVLTVILLENIYLTEEAEVFTSHIISPIKLMLSVNFLFYICGGMLVLKMFRRFNRLTSNNYFIKLDEYLRKYYLRIVRIAAGIMLYLFCCVYVAIFVTGFKKIDFNNIPAYLLIYSIAFMMMVIINIVFSASKVKQLDMFAKT